MTEMVDFDPTFDFRTDAGEGDPDSTSPTLRAYHKLLWSKPLPNGDRFDLDDTTFGAYLHHLSARGEFFLGSDTALPTWRTWQRMDAVNQLIPESERDQFRAVAYQMGGMLLFPNRQIDGKPTINQERGRNLQIADRLDLTMECIRLHYLHEPNHMAGTLDRYADFFALFEDFNGYIKFFLLQDVVSADLSTVQLFSDFGEFALPQTVEMYHDYRLNAIRFVEARNRRMVEYVAGL